MDKDESPVTIAIKDGTQVTVDAIDAHLLETGNWRFNDRRGVYRVESRGSKGAVVRTVYVLHRQILGITDTFVKVAHRDGDKTNCRRSNILVAGCPLSAGDLNQIYTVEVKRMHQVAEIASKINGLPPVSDITVRRWLEAAGIPLRTRPEISKRVNQMPHVKQAIQDMLRRRWDAIRRGDRPMLPQNKAPLPEHVKYKGRIVAAGLKRSKSEETFPYYNCDLCGRLFRRRGILVEEARRRGAKGLFCGYSCSGKAVHMSAEEIASYRVMWEGKIRRDRINRERIHRARQNYQCAYCKNTMKMSAQQYAKRLQNSDHGVCCSKVCARSIQWEILHTDSERFTQYRQHLAEKRTERALGGFLSDAQTLVKRANKD